MNLEEIRKKKLEELQGQQAETLKEQAKFQQQLEMLENLAKTHMTPEAIARYSSIKIAHTENAVRAIAFIAEGVQKGQIKHKVTDMEFKELLRQFIPKKKEFKITRR